MASVPLRRVQQLAGHADYKVTEVYAHLAPAASQDTVGKLKFLSRNCTSAPQILIQLTAQYPAKGEGRTFESCRGSHFLPAGTARRGREIPYGRSTPVFGYS